jgi:hypothetical protein
MYFISLALPSRASRYQRATGRRFKFHRGPRGLRCSEHCSLSRSSPCPFSRARSHHVARPLFHCRSLSRSQERCCRPGKFRRTREDSGQRREWTIGMRRVKDKDQSLPLATGTAVSKNFSRFGEARKRWSGRKKKHVEPEDDRRSSSEGKRAPRRFRDELSLEIRRELSKQPQLSRPPGAVCMLCRQKAARRSHAFGITVSYA